MKSIFTLFLSLSVLMLIGCGGESSGDANAETSTSSETTNSTTTTTPPSTTPPATTPTTPASTSSTDGGEVFHYICETAGCTGKGSNTAGNCAVCGSALAHNTAFHNQNSATQTPTITTTPGADGNTQTQTIQPNVEAAQNAAGVWHYTCPNGCSGGAGTAVACSSCGTTLVHNAAYHN